MDEENRRNLLRLFGGDPENKVSLLLDWTDGPSRDVADPWYTRDFAATWRDVVAGCRALFAAIGWFHHKDQSEDSPLTNF